MVFLIALLFFCSQPETDDSVPYGTPSDCLNKNVAILYDLMIKTGKEDMAMQMIEDDKKFLVFCYMNSRGIIKEILTVKFNNAVDENEVEIFESQIMRIIEISVKEKISFNVCHNDNYSSRKRSPVYLDTRTYFVNLGFPGELMVDYNYYKPKFEKAHPHQKYMSKYEYFKDKIRSYTVEE